MKPTQIQFYRQFDGYTSVLVTLPNGAQDFWVLKDEVLNQIRARQKQ